MFSAYLQKRYCYLDISSNSKLTYLETDTFPGRVTKSSRTLHAAISKLENRTRKLAPGVSLTNQRLSTTTVEICFKKKIKITLDVYKKKQVQYVQNIHYNTECILFYRSWLWVHDAKRIYRTMITFSAPEEFRREDHIDKYVILARKPMIRLNIFFMFDSDMKYNKLSNENPLTRIILSQVQILGLKGVKTT